MTRGVSRRLFVALVGLGAALGTLPARAGDALGRSRTSPVGGRPSRRSAANRHGCCSTSSRTKASRRCACRCSPSAASTSRSARSSSPATTSTWSRCRFRCATTAQRIRSPASCPRRRCRCIVSRSSSGESRRWPSGRPAPTWTAPAPRIEWRLDVKAPVWAGLAHDAESGRLFVGTDAGVLHAVETTGDGAGPTGRLDLRHRRADQGPPEVVGDAVYVASDSGFLHQLDKRTGVERWRARRSTGSPGSSRRRWCVARPCTPARPTGSACTRSTSLPARGAGRPAFPAGPGPAPPSTIVSSSPAPSATAPGRACAAARSSASTGRAARCAGCTSTRRRRSRWRRSGVGLRRRAGARRRHGLRRRSRRPRARDRPRLAHRLGPGRRVASRRRVFPDHGTGERLHHHARGRNLAPDGMTREFR